MNSSDQIEAERKEQRIRDAASEMLAALKMALQYVDPDQTSPLFPREMKFVLRHAILRAEGP